MLAHLSSSTGKFWWLVIGFPNEVEHSGAPLKPLGHRKRDTGLVLVTHISVHAVKKVERPEEETLLFHDLIILKMCGKTKWWSLSKIHIPSPPNLWLWHHTWQEGSVWQGSSDGKECWSPRRAQHNHKNPHPWGKEGSKCLSSHLVFVWPCRLWKKKMALRQKHRQPLETGKS